MKTLEQKLIDNDLINEAKMPGQEYTPFQLAVLDFNSGNIYECKRRLKKMLQDKFSNNAALLLAYCYKRINEFEACMYYCSLVNESTIFNPGHITAVSLTKECKTALGYSW